MLKRVLSVLCSVLLLGVVGAATAQYGGGGGSGGSGGSGGMSHASAPSSPYTLTKLVGDMAGAAAQVDPHLVNAWGLVAGPSTPWWVSNNHTNSSTLYDGTGAVLPLVVTVPRPPTGIVFNGGNSVVIINSTSSAASTLHLITHGSCISMSTQCPYPPLPPRPDRSAVGS